MNVRSRVGAFAAAAVLTLTAAACGTDATTAGTPGATSMSMPMGNGAGSATAGSVASGPSTVDAAHNDADVMFAQQMTVHHQGAIAMADLAPDRAERAEVKALAVRIKAAQAPEIEQMTGWLQAWGMPPMAQSSGMGGMGGMNDGSSTGNDGPGSAMPGMMTDEQMQQLTAATGAAFDKMFLEMMIAHHEGAIEMSKTEKGSGQNPDALALADTITTSQTGEIAEMKALLQGM